ncbi:CIC11C00000002493 [Sungouiella intermedia]|uniref:ADP-ribose 1''-phosphate phosphatase n=1 Tax=Sungouiella intermedia TaxID=45354 RepID=A0A1L0D6L2_9ASCO|nr:CIC11C00000002493 [[Candida] intermedia]
MLQYIKGDLFSHTSSKKVILAHACNPFGLWGGGIAAQFRKRYPSAYKLYADHCHQHGNTLLGKCLVVPADAQSKVYIACLFTSNFENSPSQIVEYTKQSMADLTEQLKTMENVETHNGKTTINMPMINSGIFNVPWKDTEAVLQSTDLNINVYIID